MDYSTKDNLPMQQGGDTLDVSVFRSLRDALDGRLVYVCTSATRPTGSARFAGRVIIETDTKRLLVWDGSAWVWLAGGVRQYRSSIAASKTTGQTITTLAILAQPVAFRVDLRFMGQVGFSAAVNQVVNITAAATAGALTVQVTPGVRCAETGQWYGLPWAGYLDLAASTASTITFSATGFSVRESVVDVTGDLTIKGVTKPVTLAVTSFQAMPHPMLKKNAIGANASVTVKRSDFNMGKYAPHVGDDVKIDIALEAINL